MTLLEELIREKYTLIGNGDYPKTEEHDSLVYNRKKDLFFWNSKGIGGDAYVWLTKILGYTDRLAKEIINERSFDGIRSYTEVITSKGESVVVYPKLAQLLWENGKSYRDYWQRRGIHNSTVDRFLLGFYEGWYTIPIFLDGALVNIQKRRDYPDKKIKYWYSGIGPSIFNGDILRIASSVILTESPTDAILLNQYGYPALSHTGGAEFWVNSWNKYFSNATEIYIVYDNDEPGINGARKVAKTLGEYKCKILNFTDFPDKYDAGDWLVENNPQEFGDYLLQESKYIFEVSNGK